MPDCFLACTCSPQVMTAAGICPGNCSHRETHFMSPYLPRWLPHHSQDPPSPCVLSGEMMELTCLPAGTMVTLHACELCSHFLIFRGVGGRFAGVLMTHPYGIIYSCCSSVVRVAAVSQMDWLFNILAPCTIHQVILYCLRS